MKTQATLNESARATIVRVPRPSRVCLGGGFDELGHGCIPNSITLSASIGEVQNPHPTKRWLDGAPAKMLGRATRLFTDVNAPWPPRKELSARLSSQVENKNHHGKEGDQICHHPAESAPFALRFRPPCPEAYPASRAFGTMTNICSHVGHAG